MKLKDLRKQKLAAARAIVDKAAAENRGCSPEEIKEHDGLVAEADALQATIERQERHETDAAYQPPASQGTGAAAQAGAAAAGAGATGGSDTTRLRSFSTNETREPGQALGTLVRAHIMFGRDKEGAVEWARQQYGESSPEVGAMNASEFTAGGAIVRGSVVNEVIPLLRAKAAVLRAQPRRVPLIGGSADLSKITGGASGTWVGEKSNAPKSQLTFGAVKLAEKLLSVVVPVGNRLLKHATPDVDLLIRDDLTGAFANTADVAYFRGAGTEFTPKGLYYWAPAGNKFASAGTTLANIRTDIRKAVNKLDSVDVPNERRAWFMTPRVANYLRWDAVDANGNFAFPSMHAAQPTLGGYPVFETNNISNLLGAGTDSEIYLCEMTEVIVGEGDELTISAYEGGAYHDGSQIISGISQNQTVIKGLLATDIGARHGEAVAVVEGVALGA